MTLEEFHTVMRELKDTYGKNYYTEELQKRVWHIVREVSQEQFRNAIDAMLEKTQRALSPVLIRKAIQPALNQIRSAKKIQKIEKLKAEGSGCDWCGYTGLVQCYDKENPGYQYSFVCCNCSAAELLNLSQSLPLWKEEREERFMPLKLDPPSFKWVKEQLNQQLGIKSKKGSNSDIEKFAEAVARKEIPREVSNVNVEGSNANADLMLL